MTEKKRFRSCVGLQLVQYSVVGRFLSFVFYIVAFGKWEGNQNKKVFVFEFAGEREFRLPDRNEFEGMKSR